MYINKIVVYLNLNLSYQGNKINVHLFLKIISEFILYLQLHKQIK